MEKREWKIEAEPPRWLAFVAVGALLGIKPIWRDANILLHWMQTRGMTEADDRAGLERLVASAGWESGGFF